MGNMRTLFPLPFRIVCTSVVILQPDSSTSRSESHWAITSFPSINTIQKSYALLLHNGCFLLLCSVSFSWVRLKEMRLMLLSAESGFKRWRSAVSGVQRIRFSISSVSVPHEAIDGPSIWRAASKRRRDVTNKVSRCEKVVLLPSSVKEKESSTNALRQLRGRCFVMPRTNATESFSAMFFRSTRRVWKIGDLDAMIA